MLKIIRNLFFVKAFLITGQWVGAGICVLWIASNSSLNAVADESAAKPMAVVESSDELPFGAVARMGTNRWRVSGNGFVAFSPDSQFVFGEGPLKPRCWEVSSGKEVETSPDFPLTRRFGFSNNGQRLLTDEGNGQIIVRDAKDHRAISRIFFRNTIVGQGKLSPDGRSVAIVTRRVLPESEIRSRTRSDERKPRPIADFSDVSVWDSETGERRYLVTIDNEAIRSLAFSPDSTILAAYPTHGLIGLWDTSTGKELGKLPVGGTFRQSCVFTPDGQTLLVLAGRHVVPWDVRTLQAKPRLALATDSPIQLSDDARWLLTHSVGRFEIWDLIGLKKALDFGENVSGFSNFAFSPDGNWFTAVSPGSRAIRLWDLRTGQQRHVTTGHQSVVTSAAFSPDGQQVVTGAEDGMYQVWDFSRRTEPQTFREARYDKISSVAWSPNGEFVLAASRTGGAVIRDSQSGQVVHRFRTGMAGSYACGISPDGQTVVSCDTDNFLRAWSVKSRKPLAQFSVTAVPVTDVRFVDNERVWVSTFGPRGLLVEITSGQVKKNIEGNRFTGSSDGKWFAICRDTLGFSLVDDIGTQVFDGQLQLHPGHSAAFSTDNRFLAVGSRDQTLVFNLKKWNDHGAFTGHLGRVTAVAFSVDGQRLVSGGEDTTVIVWDMSKLPKLVPPPPRANSRDPKDGGK